MKKTKEPSGKYPALYYQRGIGSLVCGDRLRIIYPDGSAEYYWMSDWSVPCWKGRKGTFNRQIELMKRYDSSRLFSPAEFIGEIK